MNDDSSGLAFFSRPHFLICVDICRPLLMVSTPVLGYSIGCDLRCGETKVMAEDFFQARNGVFLVASPELGDALLHWLPVLSSKRRRLSLAAKVGRDGWDNGRAEHVVMGNYRRSLMEWRRLIDGSWDKGHLDWLVQRSQGSQPSWSTSRVEGVDVAVSWDGLRKKQRGTHDLGRSPIVLGCGSSRRHGGAEG